MDLSPLFDPEYLPIVLGTLLGFGLLAAALLVPVYRFLDREQKVAKEWTPETLARRLREQKGTPTDGAAEEKGPSDPSASNEESDHFSDGF